jgi:hypothetical protein
MEFQASYRWTARWIVVISEGIPGIGSIKIRANEASTFGSSFCAA